MLRVMIAGGFKECRVIENNINRTQPDCEIVAKAIDGNAFETAVGQNVDVVIADYEMKDMDGLTLCKKIKEHSEEIQVILCVDRDRFIEVGKELKVSGAEYVLKPIAAAELTHISNLLSKYREDKHTTEYLSFVLTEKRFEDEVLRNLIKSLMSL